MAVSIPYSSGLWLSPLIFISFSIIPVTLSSFSFLSEGYLVGIFQTTANFKNDPLRPWGPRSFSTWHPPENHPSAEVCPLSQRVGTTSNLKSLWDLSWILFLKWGLVTVSLIVRVIWGLLQCCAENTSDSFWLYLEVCKLQISPEFFRAKPALVFDIGFPQPTPPKFQHLPWLTL